MWTAGNSRAHIYHPLHDRLKQRCAFDETINFRQFDIVHLPEKYYYTHLHRNVVY